MVAALQRLAFRAAFYDHLSLSVGATSTPTAILGKDIDCVKFTIQHWPLTPPMRTVRSRQPRITNTLNSRYRGVFSGQSWMDGPIIHDFGVLVQTLLIF